MTLKNKIKKVHSNNIWGHLYALKHRGEAQLVSHNTESFIGKYLSVFELLALEEFLKPQRVELLTSKVALKFLGDETEFFFGDSPFVNLKQLYSKLQLAMPRAGLQQEDQFNLAYMNLVGEIHQLQKQGMVIWDQLYALVKRHHQIYSYLSFLERPLQEEHRTLTRMIQTWFQGSFSYSFHEVELFYLLLSLIGRKRKINSQALATLEEEFVKGQVATPTDKRVQEEKISFVNELSAIKFRDKKIFQEMRFTGHLNSQVHENSVILFSSKRLLGGSYPLLLLELGALGSFQGSFFYPLNAASSTLVHQAGCQQVLEQALDLLGLGPLSQSLSYSSCDGFLLQATQSRFSPKLRTHSGNYWGVGSSQVLGRNHLVQELYR